MTGLKTIKPSPSYSITLPEDIVDSFDERVSNFWIDGKQLLLQLSSYLRAEGSQLSARDRLGERISKHNENWTIWSEKAHPEDSIDQATAEFLDRNGVLWVHSYFVWPHLTIYVTISGPPSEVREPKNWATQALKSLRLTIN